MGKIRLEDLHPELQKVIRTVTGKRPKTVIDYILEHGAVTTEDLERLGYAHAPRAARDVRECGVPLKTTRVTGSSGKKIASYIFGNPADVEHHKLGGRNVLPKELVTSLYRTQQGRCAVCSTAYNARYLSTDHRVPYEIAGEAAAPTDTAAFMLLCASCQRKKSFECERCPNWQTKESNTCQTCFWTRPSEYEHLATRRMRRIEVSFTGTDVDRFDFVADSADDIHEYVKQAILKYRNDED